MSGSRMSGLWLDSGDLRVREDLPVPSPPEGEALVRVRLAGICSTDLELVRGYYPYAGVLGHEFVGVVERAPTASSLEGVRVVGEINAACGACTQCRTGRTTHCTQRTVLGIVDRDGAFAEFLLLPVENLHPVPDSIPDEVAVFAEPLAAALEIQEQIQIRPNQRVMVVGAGRLGQLVAQTLQLTGCDLQVVARYPEQHSLLTARGVATLREEEAPAGSVDLVVEATGAPDGFALARKAVRPRGTIVLKSTYKGIVPVDFSSVVVDEITLVGSRCGPFGPALRLLERGTVDPRPLIRDRFPLAQGQTAFEAAAQGGAFKILLHPD